MATPAYTRLAVDERRSRLLELGAELFARHGYEELSMSRIAREAGISKALLYHYFPSKQAYFSATLEQTAQRILAGLTETEPDPALRAAVRGWLWFMDGVVLDWIEHRDIDRARLHGLLLGTLLGAVTAAGSPADA